MSEILEPFNTAKVRLEDIHKRAKELIDDIEDLPGDRKDKISESFSFQGPWKKEKIKSQLDRLEEAVDDWKRYESKELLREVGLNDEQIEEIPEERLIATPVFKELKEKFEDIKEEYEEDFTFLKKILVEKNFLVKWLAASTHSAISKITMLKEHPSRYREGVLKLKEFNSELKEVFFVQSLKEGIQIIRDARELNRDLGKIKRYSVSITLPKEKEEVKKFSKVCKKTDEFLGDLKGFVSQRRIKNWVKNTKLTQAKKKLSKKLKEVKKEVKKKRNRCEELAEALGKEGTTCETNNLSPLSKTVEKLEKELKSKLGDVGKAILDLFKDKNPSIEGYSKAELIEGLKKLNNLFELRGK